MPVSADVQAMIAQRYAQLAAAVMSGDSDTERSLLAPSFADRASSKLASFDLDALTVVVVKIDADGKRLVVHARYYGVHGHTTSSLDHWGLIDGAWRLLDRN
jgi:hypothetical protein